MSEHVRFEIGALCESFVAAGEWADERTVASVNANVCAQVEVEAELLPAAFEWTLQIEK